MDSPSSLTAVPLLAIIPVMTQSSETPQGTLQEEDEAWEVNSEIFLLKGTVFCQKHLFLRQSLRSPDQPVVLPASSRIVHLTPKAVATEILSSDTTYKTMGNY